MFCLKKKQKKAIKYFATALKEYSSHPKSARVHEMKVDESQMCSIFWIRSTFILPSRAPNSFPTVQPMLPFFIFQWSSIWCTISDRPSRWKSCSMVSISTLVRPRHRAQRFHLAPMLSRSRSRCSSVTAWLPERHRTIIHHLFEMNIQKQKKNKKKNSVHQN